MSELAASEPLDPATRAVTAGRPPRSAGADPNVPVHLSSTFVAHGEIGYGRFGNPTWQALESAIGELEGGQALVLSSGMAAVTAAMSLAPRDATIVAPDCLYSGTNDRLLLAEQHGATLRRVAADDTAGWLSALVGSDLVWLESPTNPLMQVTDLPRVIAAARELGVLVVADNTVATPLLCQPLALGADVVVHSVTKYLSGHSDVVMGAVVTAPTDRGRQLHEQLHRERTLGGGIVGPLEAFLALRGLRTLAVRFAKASASARVLADRLREHPRVARVRYPGTGAMLSIDLDGDAAAAERVCAGTALWLDSTSLGGVESQLERRRRHPSEPASVPENLVRLSVGIEDVEDLWRDLRQALDLP